MITLADFTHNTGRAYGANGQPIRIRRYADGIVTFQDLARGIRGEVMVFTDENGLALVADVMSAYDANAYESFSDRVIEEMESE